MSMQKKESRLSLQGAYGACACLIQSNQPPFDCYSNIQTYHRFGQLILKFLTNQNIPKLQVQVLHLVNDSFRCFESCVDF